MTIKPLIESVEIITDEQGRKKAILDWQVWEEIVALLESYFQPKTELGRQLWAARFEILASSGTSLLNREALKLELAGWDALSDEALAEMERTLQAPAAITGKYRSVPTSSEEFAQRKQEEIERED